MAGLLDGRRVGVVGVATPLADALAAALARDGAVVGDAVDALVVGAGDTAPPEPFAEADADLASWRAAVETGVFGALDTIRPVVEAMRDKGSGAIVFVCSALVREPRRGRGAAAVVDRGLLGAAQVLARELGPSGVRVNTVVAGDDAAAAADTIVFFVSDLAEVVTGQSIDVDYSASSNAVASS